MKKVNDFEKKYPLFVPYVVDANMRDNMLTNDDLLRKYNEHYTEIQNFVQEIDSRFDGETVLALLQNSVFKFPDAILLSFIKAYLSSSEAVKNNKDVIKFYNKILHLGEECVHYIEVHGIITNRSWRDIPSLVVKENYNKYKKGDEEFKGLSLDDAFDSLNLNEKKLVVDLLRNNSFELLNLLFASLEMDLSSLLSMLLANNIDAEILNKDVVEGLGDYNLLLLLFQIWGNENSDIIVINVRYLIKQKRFDLLKTLAVTKSVASLSEYDLEELGKMSDEELIQEIMKKGYNLLKKDE